jgi:hypothetical protein
MKRNRLVDGAKFVKSIRTRRRKQPEIDFGEQAGRGEAWSAAFNHNAESMEEGHVNPRLGTSSGCPKGGSAVPWRHQHISGGLDEVAHLLEIIL